MSDKLALFDLDGTLANDLHRKPAYLAKDWATYWDYDSMMSDPVWEPARQKIRVLEDAGWHVWVLTARLEDYNREVTEEWLTANGFGDLPALLRPRAWSDLRPPQFKSRMLGLIKGSSDIGEVVLYDNDPDVVEEITKHHGAQHVVHCTWENEAGEPA